MVSGELKRHGKSGTSKPTGNAGNKSKNKTWTHQASDNKAKANKDLNAYIKKAIQKEVNAVSKNAKAETMMRSLSMPLICVTSTMKTWTTSRSTLMMI